MLGSSAAYREFLHIKLFPYTRLSQKQVRLRRRGILLCLLDNTFSSKKQPVKDGEATEGYVLDRLLSLMNIISQANIYLILCACTQPRILPQTIGNKVHSVSEANTRLTPKA